MDVERIRQSHEEIEERSYIDRFGNLRVTPTVLAQALNLGVGDFVGVSRERSHEFQQVALGRAYRCAIEITVAQCLGNRAVLLSLQLQEPCVTAESVVTAIQRRHI